MDREFAQFERLESSLRELREADRAGVLERTRVDAQALFTRPVFARPVASRTNRLLMYRVGSIAAVLLVAFTVWSVMFIGQVRHLQGRAHMVANTGTNERPFFAKLTGPSVAVAGSKNPNDFDGDGDLDLADIRTFQLQFAVNR